MSVCTHTRRMFSRASRRRMNSYSGDREACLGLTLTYHSNLGPGRLSGPAIIPTRRQILILNEGRPVSGHTGRMEDGLDDGWWHVCGPQGGGCDHHTSVLNTECVALGQHGCCPHKVSCHLPAGGWGWGRGWGWGEHMAVNSSLGCHLPRAATRMLFPQVRSCGPLLHSFVLAVTRLAGSVGCGVGDKRNQFSIHQ